MIVVVANILISILLKLLSVCKVYHAFLRAAVSITIASYKSYIIPIILYYVAPCATKSTNVGFDLPGMRLKMQPVQSNCTTFSEVLVLFL